MEAYEKRLCTSFYSSMNSLVINQLINNKKLQSYQTAAPFESAPVDCNSFNQQRVDDTGWLHLADPDTRKVGDAKL